MRIRTLKASIPTVNTQTVPPLPRETNPAYRTSHHVGWALQVKRRAGFACQRCGRQEQRMFADHIVELKDGGTWTLDNGQCLCGSCHTTKTVIEKTKRLFNTV